MPPGRPPPSPDARHWALDPEVVFLNHGSFGACPRPVMQAQAHLRERLESEPVRFFTREYEGLLDRARAALAAFVGADAEGMVFVPNATTAVTAVLRSWGLSPGDELLITDHAYPSCRDAALAAAEAAGARVAVALVPFPIDAPERAVQAVLAAVTPRTRLALIDHVTSPTALAFPVRELVAALGARGVPALVDGAHAPGSVPLDLSAIGAAAYAGNCHKWLCAPKGAGFLHVREDLRARVRPPVAGDGRGAFAPGRSSLHAGFGWPGTHDPTAALCVPEAIAFGASLHPDGWPGLMAANREKALRVRDLLCAALSAPPPCPDAMIASMASVPLADAPPSAASSRFDPLYDALCADGVQVPLFPWPAPPRRLVRVSAHAYNSADQFAYLADRLRARLGR